MVQPKLEQTAYNACARYERKDVTVWFDDITANHGLIVLEVIFGGGQCDLQVPSGFTVVRIASRGNVQVGKWYYQDAPPMESVTVIAKDHRSIQVRAREYSGAALTNVLDQVVVATDESDQCHTGTTGITAQADEIISATVANAYTSCSQRGFSGGLARLFENLSPQSYRRYYSTYYNDDSDRTRCTHHHLIVSIITTWFLTCEMTSSREWVAILCTFRGASSGPKQMSSKLQGPVLKAGNGGRALLYCFGALTSTQQSTPMSSNPRGSAVIYPFNYQYWIGTQRLLIGSKTKFLVQGTEGLYGMLMRSSDTNQPRNDGDQRGIDLQSARDIIFTMKIGRNPDEIALLSATLYRALIPQRDSDWPLIWRMPDEPAKMMMVRPIDVPQTRNNTQLTYADRKFALRAADPRHYSAVPKHVLIPNSPNPSAPVIVPVTNEGDIAAYPVITVIGPTSGPSITRVTLTNRTNLILFDVQLTVPNKATLVGDMQSRITGAPVSHITLDGQPKYGAWQLPRDTFRIEADPTGMNGFNEVYLTTVPAGAPVLCTLDYRDTWAG
jgi:hypothetical protein